MTLSDARLSQIARSARVLLILKRKLPWPLTSEDTQREVLENLVHLEWRSHLLQANTSGSGAYVRVAAAIATGRCTLHISFQRGSTRVR